MNILNKEYLKCLKKNIIFILVYTIIFILVYNTFKYIAPFLIGAIIAFLINPISSRLKTKFNINKGISTIVLSFFTVTIFIALTVVMVMRSIDNVLEFINNLVNNYDYVNQAIEEFNMNINIYMQQLENIPSVDIESLISKYSRNLISISTTILENILSVFTSIPYITIFIITLFMATYFIAKDLDNIEMKVYSLFTEPTRTKVKSVKKEMIKSGRGYIKAYTILMVITFIITWLSFSFFKIPYALLLSVVTCVLDLVPLLGIVVIYVPCIIYHWIINEKLIAISIAIIFLLLSIIREVLEPKLLAMNIGISPLATLSAIFIGVQVKGIVGIIFFLGLIVMHKILKKVDII